MKLVGRNTDFSAKPVFEAVRESCRRIVHHRTGIDLPQESRRRFLIFRDNTFSVIRAKRGNMVHSSLNMLDNSNG